MNAVLTASLRFLCDVCGCFTDYETELEPTTVWVPEVACGNCGEFEFDVHFVQLWCWPPAESSSPKTRVRVLGATLNREGRAEVMARQGGVR